MKSKYIKAAAIILDDQLLENVYLEVCEDGCFGMIQFAEPVQQEIIDYGDYILAAGLVDTHIHGYASYDVMDNSFEALETISKGLLACGVTSWLPTTLTDSTERLNAVCETIGKYGKAVSGAKIQGIFLEGPFFTEKYKGAQNAKYMGDPSIEKLQHWHTLSQHEVRKIAIAPERDGVKEFIQYAKEQEIHIALGHSDATYAQAQAAVEAGASIFVHTYNGMRGLHHREPGMLGAALNLKNVYAEVIADGLHVHPAAIELLTKARGLAESVLVTDCMRAGGQGDGLSCLGEFDVIVKDGAARLAESGNLAGSVLELIQAVQNIVAWDITDLASAVRMASLNAAKSVGLEAICGSIQAGRAADFIVIDQAGQLIATYLDGERRYTQASQRS